MPTIFLAPLPGNGSWSNLEPSCPSYPFLLPFFSFYPFHTMNQPSICHPAAPKGVHLEPPPSSHPILSPSYELHPSFIAIVQKLSCAGEEDENLYTHLHDFEQLCSWLLIEGMTRNTLKWKLFPLSLMGVAKHWYARHVESAHGEWEILQSKFCLAFFPISRVAHLRREILNF